MKFFTKLALVSAIAVSGSAMAMESLDDSAMSATTGQEGITLKVNTDGIQIAKLLIHDNDGMTTATGAAVGAVANNFLQAEGGTGTAGAIVVEGVSIAKTAVGGALGGNTLASVHIDTDAGASGTAPFLNIAAVLDAVTITVDSIKVGASNAVSATSATRGATSETEIISGYSSTDKLTVGLGVSKLNIQLGNATTQGALIQLNGEIAGGLTVSNVAVKDAANGGAIGIDSIRITDSGTANLTVNTKIKATTAGLEINPTGTQDIYMSAVRLGDFAGFAGGTTASIGSVEIQGMNMGTNAAIIVSGH